MTGEVYSNSLQVITAKYCACAIANAKDTCLQKTSIQAAV